MVTWMKHYPTHSSLFKTYLVYFYTFFNVFLLGKVQLKTFLKEIISNFFCPPPVSTMNKRSIYEGDLGLEEMGDMD